MRVIVIAAGDGTRWGNHTGVPKHLAVMEGERLIDRTSRLFAAYGGTEPLIVAPVDDERYQTKDGMTVAPKLNPTRGGADKFLSSRYIWNTVGRTVIVYGDVWFSEEAVETITSHESEEITFFGRAWGSKLTGTPWGELFAVSLTPETVERAEASLKHLARLYKRSPSIRAGGWEWYKHLHGLPIDPSQHSVAGGFVEINDWTDDIDYPEDYQRWISRRRKGI